jgi:putative transposase
VFGTKDRAPTINDDLRDRLFPYIGGIVHEIGATALIVNGTCDHVHVLASVPATISIADLMGVVKANSSRWVNDQRIVKGRFAWQSGYGAFSVSQSNIESVRAYIAKQEEHHLRITFAEEYVSFLKKHGVAYDERYLWE